MRWWTKFRKRFMKKKRKKRKMLSKIIIHHSLTKDGQTVSWGAIRRYHTIEKGWEDIGYHFGLELVGTQYEILIGRMMNVVGAHTKGYNTGSLGVCFIGNFDLTMVSIEQWELGIRLVSSLCEVLSIKIDQVYGHKDFANKSCPGLNFDLRRFKKEVKRDGIFK